MSQFIGNLGIDPNAPNAEPEEPEFIIEVEGEENPPVEITVGTTSSGRWKKWLRRLVKALAVVFITAATIAVYKVWNYYNYYHNIGVSVSTEPEDNIKKLKMPAKKETAKVVLTSDSILGVALDFYAIHGLSANIEFEEPDTADASVFLYSRSADHNADNTYIGSLVVDGKEMQSDVSRLGYMGMVGNQMVIGISRSDKVKDYCKKNGGSFFRQYILVSKGGIPQKFFLHGKVERRALGRMKDDTLYYIATRNKETLYDFADALREYGFVDAIYITGGTDYSFYRTADGLRHDIGNIEDYPHKKWKGVIPWLVFRSIE